MIDELSYIVKYGERLGADFVEVRYDDLSIRTLEKVNDSWKNLSFTQRKGIGILCYIKGASGYAFTASNQKNDIENATKQAFKIGKTLSESINIKLDFNRSSSIESHSSDSFKVKIHPMTKDLEYKKDLVNRFSETIAEEGKNINNITLAYGEIYGNKQFTNSEGSNINWDIEITDLFCTISAKTNSGELVSNFEFLGGTNWLEKLETKGSQPEDIGREFAFRINEQLNAKHCPAGKFRCLIENSLAGVLAHESFGHLAEGDFVITGRSPLSERIGEAIGSEAVTIIDSGVPNIDSIGGIWLPYDDQGSKGTETTILEKGILENYLHNRSTAQFTNQEPTGNCRAVHFGFRPIPRMTNTYFTPGDLTEEEALELLDTGIYAIKSSGGQVQLDGNFVFMSTGGYWVEKGEKKHPLKAVTLTGNILTLLSRVEGATRDLALDGMFQLGCGKLRQYPLPVGTGGPKLLVSEVQFAGQT